MSWHTAPLIIEVGLSVWLAMQVESGPIVAPDVRVGVVADRAGGRR